MKHIKSLVLVAAGCSLLFAAACNTGAKRRNPGQAYAMDMTYSKAYDYYNMYDPSDSDKGHPSRLPVEGTVARGHELPDHMSVNDTSAGVQDAFNTMRKFNAAEVTEGGRLFNIYCGICHGQAMDGQGPLYTSGKFAAMPANLKTGEKVGLSNGHYYYVIKYGKGAMGPYASQLDIKQRWMIISYIRQFQSQNGGPAFTMGDATPDISGIVPKNDTTQGVGQPAPSVPGVDTSKAGSAAAKAQRGNEAAARKDNQALNNARARTRRQGGRR